MFPLGAVLFPTMVMPLHVFEPRYRQLMADCLAGDREFGVTLIERGSEVGGGDMRTDVGTAARITEAQELDDGRWILTAVGTERIRIDHWLADDPYPLAEVEPWPDVDVTPPHGVAICYEARCAQLRRLLAFATEMGLSGAPSTLELADDPATGGWQLAVSAPLGQFDRQRLLVAPGLAARLELLGQLLEDADQILLSRLADMPAREDDSPDLPGDA